MSRSPGICRIRKTGQSGFTLVEMLFCCLIIGLAGAAIAALLLANNMTVNRVSNKADNLNAARAAIDQIGRQVRMAQNIGDCYGTVAQVDPSDPSLYGYYGSETFPSSNNPLYSTSSVNYPGSPQTLVVQMPVVDSNGWPTIVPAGYGTPAAGAFSPNVDTYVYQVVADPIVANQYQMQVSIYPGYGSSANSGTRVMLKGIVGPLNESRNADGTPASGSTPQVFQYLNRITGSLESTPTDANFADYNGVIVNLEVQNNYSQETATSTIALRNECFLRNNTIATFQNTAGHAGADQD